MSNIVGTILNLASENKSKKQTNCWRTEELLCDVGYVTVPLWAIVSLLLKCTKCYHGI